MTGYGRGVGRADGVSVEVEISSVNRKQLDVQCVLSRPLQILESRILEETASRIHRGRLVVTVRPRADTPGRAVEVRFRTPLAEACVEALRQAGRRLGLPDDLKTSSLAAWPDLLEIVRREDDATSAWPAVRIALRKALAGLLDMRETEGRVLVRDVKRRIARLRLAHRRIRTLAPGAVARYRAALKTRLREAGVEVGAAEERLLKEIAFYADRVDIAEELTRLDSHLEQCGEALQTGGLQGRSLDFLAQELQREINTISSKSGDSGILRECIAFKSELERLREQVQNIE
jgi:uncharacterized protein (TIGR00255 family)